jgi:pyrimidine-nucleoside phosphorylase
MDEWIEIIVKKKNSERLEPEEIARFVEGVQKDEIAPEQASAFLMAAVLNGLDEEESTTLTKALMNSGQMLDFRDLGYPTVDIGETGGLGSNAPLVAIPVAASYGAKLPVVAEKSLGIFCGLLDKFESIPGFRTDLGTNEFQESVRNIGVAITGQSTEMAPADTRINQLRTRTGTLGGISLTVASLLSRKASAGIRGLVTEIACGSGGFARNLTEAHQLADDLVNVGEGLGFFITGCITDRNNPLGRFIGDSLELREAIDVLNGGGPEDLKEVAVDLASSLLVIGQLATDQTQGRTLAEEALADGRAYAKLKDLVSNQGGDTMVLDNPDHLPRAQGQRQILTQRAGYVKAVDCEALGEALLELGGSRRNRGDGTDHRVGIEIHKKVGDQVSRGEPLATLYTSERSKTEAAIEATEEAYLLSPEPGERTRPILENFGRRR